MKKYLILLLSLLLLIPSLSWGACTYTSNGDGSGTLSNCSIDANSDYCLQVGSAACVIGSPSYDMYVPYSSTNSRDVFLRYKANIPQNATISSAYLTFTPKTTSTAAGAVSIDLLEEDSCAMFITTDNTVSRVSTNAPSAVSWSHGTSDWVADVTENSPDIKTLVQAWIDRESYVYDSYIGLYVATVSGSSHVARHGTTYGPVLVVNYTGGDPVLSEVYMADPHVRTKQYLYIQLFNTTSTQKLKVTLDGTDVTGSPFTNIAGQSVAGEQKVLVDYTSLSAGEHTLRAVILNASDEEYASSVWTRTWTTLHDGAPYAGINENNSLVVNGQLVLPVSDFLMMPSQWSNFPDSGDTWNSWFNTSLSFGSGSGYSIANAQSYLNASGGTSYRIGPGYFGGFGSTDRRSSMVDFKISETFEGAGTPATSGTNYSQPSTALGTTAFEWTSSGTVDFDYSAAPLAGSQSLQITGAGYAQLQLNSVYGRVKLKLRVKPTTRSGVTDLLTFIDDADEVVGKVKINASNKIEVHHCSGGTCTGDDVGTGTYNFADNTEHYLWVEFKTDVIGATYNQGSLFVYAAATGTQPATADAKIDFKGSGNGRVKYIQLAASAGNVMVYDNIQDDVEDLTENVNAVKDPVTYPKLLAWLFDDEPEMGTATSWNISLPDWKNYVRTLDTNHPFAIASYGTSFNEMSSTYSGTYYALGNNYDLYLTNNVGWGTKRIFADIMYYDLYIYEYSWNSDPLNINGSKAGWYPNWENFVASVDRFINGNYNLVVGGVVTEPDDLSDILCSNTTTYYNFACTDNNKTMNVPVGSISGTFTASTAATPKYVRFGGDNSKVAELLDVRLNEGTAADNYKFKIEYPYPHPSYNSHIVIHELNSTFDSDTLANGDAIVECTSITGAYGSATCAATGEATATVITGNTAKVPYLGGTVSKRRPGGTGFRIWTPMPTPDGYNSYVWLSLIHGHRAIGNFPRHTASSFLHKATLAQILADTTALTNVILGPVADTKFTVPSANKGGWATVSATDETGTARVDYTVRTYGGVDYVFAGRVKKYSGDAAETINVTIPIVGVTGSTTISRYGEAGSPTAGTGTITDSFTPHQVRIYQVGVAASTYELSVVKAGDGSGTVVSDIGAINCGATCSDDYPTGSSVTLTASVVGNNALGAWSGGGCSGNGATCTVSMTEAIEVTKSFTDTTPRNFNVTVSYAGTGTGVTDPVAGVHPYANNATATTTQTPTSPSTFTGWSGTCGCTGSGACAPTVTADCTIIATWAAPTYYTLTVGYPQNGELITSDTGGINCGRENYECSKPYVSGTVTLSCNPAVGFYNCTFSGDCTGSTCSPEMTANKSVSVASTNGRCVTLGPGGTMTLGAGGGVNPPNCNASVDKLGTDDISGNPPDINPDTAWCSPYTPSCYGNLVKAYVRHAKVVESSARICVYKDNGDLVANAGDTKVACSGDITSSAIEWASADMDAGDDLTTGYYWVCLGVKSGGNTFTVDRSSTTNPFAYKTASGMYASPPDNLNGYTTTSGTGYSTYVTVGP